MKTTLRQIIAEHPDWLDLPVGIYCPDGHIDFVGEAGEVYDSNHNDDPDVDPDNAPGTYQILVFAPN